MPYRRPKICCEICGETNKKTLDRHHIIPKTDPNCTELDTNLAVVCASCHRKIHALDIIIEGVFSTSAGRHLFWHYKGEPYVVRPGIILHSDGTATVKEG